MLPLDHGGLETELAGADRRHIATRPAAEHDQVEIAVSHGPFFLRPLQADGLIGLWSVCRVAGVQ